ncbi:MAG: hypothetical protein ACD_18C00116G0001, partial [uncultured bacterium]
PVIEVDPVVEIPDFAKITKSPADPRFTVAGPAADVVIGEMTNTKEATTAITNEFLLNFPIDFITISIIN